MVGIFECREISEGIYFNRIVDERFKANRITITFQTEFDELSRSDHAAASYIIPHCSREYPTNMLLSKRLSSLYDSPLTTRVGFGRFNNRIMFLNTEVVGNNYAFGGEDLEAEISKLVRGCVIEPLASGGAFDEKNASLMKSELIDTIDSVINDKSAYAAEHSNKTAFIGEPLAIPVLGTHEDAEKVTPESAYAAYKRTLENARIEIYAAGNSNFKAAEKILGSMFTDIKRRNIVKLEQKPSVLKAEPVFVSEHLPMQQGILRMIFKAPELEDREAMGVLSSILGVLPTSRFFQNIREKQSLCYYCSCSVNKSLRTLTVQAGVKPENLKRTEQAVIEEIEKLQKDGVTAEETEMAKLDSAESIRSLYDSTGSLINWYANRSRPGEFTSPEEQLQKILAVDEERIREAARAYRLDTVYTLSGEDSE